MDDKDLTIIIPAAGVGRGMKSYGPKSLINIEKNINILGRQLMILQDIYPKADIIIVTGFKKEKVNLYIKQWKENRIVGSQDIKIAENKDYENNNTARSIYLGAKKSKRKNFLVVYGDLVFNKEGLSEIEFSDSGVVVEDKNQMEKTKVGVSIINGKIGTFAYAFKEKWCQILFMNDKDMNAFLELTKPKKPEKDIFKYFTHEILNILLEKNIIELKAYKSEKLKISEVNNTKSLKLIREDLEKGVYQ